MSERSTDVLVFCSYAREDEMWFRRLENHLSLLQRQGLVSLWHHRLIVPGTDWAKTIDTQLETASIILLLVSADFFASDYCYGIEMKRALERQKAGEAQVIPILVRAVDLKDAPFVHLQALPTGANPIASWRDSDSALVNVAEGIRRVIEQASLRPDILPDNKQAVSKEGNGHDEVDPPPQLQGKERESYIGSSQHLETFARQQDEFDLALVRTMPGQGSYVKTYLQAKNKRVIDRVLSSLADVCEACDLWWFAGGSQHGPACPIKKLTEKVWLIQHDECEIIDLWVYRHPTFERQYVLLHLAPQPPFGLYSGNANDREEAGYYKGRYVTRGEYDDGYAEIDEEIIKLQGVELRSRNLILNRMSDIQDRPDAGSREMANAFRYNLSAYLAAARSIVFVMKLEFGKVQGFNSWVQIKIDEFSKNDVMIYLKDKRNITIHEGPVELQGKKLLIITDYFGSNDELLELSQNEGENEESYLEAIPNSTLSEERIELQWFFDKFQPNNVLTVCGVHLSKLRSFVDECEAKFAKVG